MNNKECYMDYATAAFIKYSELGCPTKAEYEARIRSDIYMRFAEKTPELIVKLADKEVQRNEGVLLDIEAVNKTFDMLLNKIPLDTVDTAKAVRNGSDIANALSYVYFGLHREKPSNKRICARVRLYATSLPTDERTVYRWLKYGRRLFAINRGLACDKLS